MPDGPALDGRLKAALFLGAALLLGGMFLAIMTPYGIGGGFTALAGLLLMMVAGTITVVRSIRRHDGERLPRTQRIASLVCLALAALGWFASSALTPPVAGADAFCAEDAPHRVSPDVWFAVRDAQIGSYRFFDARNDTTYMVVGCSHEGSEVALRIRGDHTRAGPDGRLLLSLAAGSPEEGRIPFNQSGAPVRNATAAVFAARSVIPVALAKAVPGLLLAASIALSGVSPWRRALVAGSGAVGGGAVALARLDAGYGLGDFLLAFPAMMGLMLAGLGLALAAKPSMARRTAGLFLFLFGLFAILYFIALVDYFPTHPEA